MNEELVGVELVGVDQGPASAVCGGVWSMYALYGSSALRRPTLEVLVGEVGHQRSANAGRRGGEWAPARPSAGSFVGRLRVSSAWRGPCAALRKAAGGEGASGASTGRRAPPAAGGGPCRRVPAPWTGQGGSAAAPRPRAGDLLVEIVSGIDHSFVHVLLWYGMSREWYGKLRNSVESSNFRDLSRV